MRPAAAAREVGAPLFRAALRAILRARAVDVTADAAHRSCLVIAPHPDDETLGCGAAVARKRAAGTPVTVLVVSAGQHSTTSSMLSPAQIGQIRRLEAVVACARIGVAVEKVRFLDHVDGALAECEGALRDQFRELLLTMRPDEVLVTSPGDPHRDHAAVGRAAVEAARGLPVRVLTYPIWQWEQRRLWFAPVRFTGPGGASRRLSAPLWGHCERVSTEGYLARKRDAFSAYASQVQSLTGESSWTVLPDQFRRHFFQRYEFFFPVQDREIPHVSA